MLRRAIQRTRLHLPAPIGHDNGVDESSNEDDTSFASVSVAYTTLRDDQSKRERFPEAISNVYLTVGGAKRKVQNDHVAKISSDEDRRAAEAWARLKTLYGLFRELEAAADEETEAESVTVKENDTKQQRFRHQRKRNDGLRSILHEIHQPPDVLLQMLAMTDGCEDNGLPQGFTAGMFTALGNAIYNEMLVATEQNRISPDAFEELGNCLYADTANVTVSATA